MQSKITIPDVVAIHAVGILVQHKDKKAVGIVTKVDSSSAVVVVLHRPDGCLMPATEGCLTRWLFDEIIYFNGAITLANDLAPMSIR